MFAMAWSAWSDGLLREVALLRRQFMRGQKLGRLALVAAAWAAAPTIVWGQTAFDAAGELPMGGFRTGGPAARTGGYSVPNYYGGSRVFTDGVWIGDNDHNIAFGNCGT